MNPNWQRWIHASLCQYVKTSLTTLGVYVHFEGDIRTPLDSQQDYAEFQWNGPDAQELSRGYWQLDLDLAFIVTSTTGRQDAHVHKRVVGLVQSILTNSISIFKHGTGDGDDGSLLGCLQLRVGTIRTNYFGRVMDPIEIEQSTIEADYYMTFRP